MIPEPVYDDGTGAYIPQEWERFVPAGMQLASGEITRDGAWEQEWGDPACFESLVAGPVSRISIWMEKGALPFPGSVLDQPARLLRAVSAWREAVDQCNLRMQKRRGAHDER